MGNSTESYRFVILKNCRNPYPDRCLLLIAFSLIAK